VVSGNLLVNFNTDGDAIIAMQILVQGRTTLLGTGDFAL
jgi:hypothetical protein